MIGCRRYAGLMDHNADAGTVFVSKEDGPFEETPA
jgi:hypothetical protein